MSKTNDTSKLDHAKLENRVLADSELDAVTGGDARTDPGDDDDKMSGGDWRRCTAQNSVSSCSRRHSDAGASLTTPRKRRRRVATSFA